MNIKGSIDPEFILLGKGKTRSDEAKRCHSEEQDRMNIKGSIDPESILLRKGKTRSDEESLTIQE